MSALKVGERGVPQTNPPVPTAGGDPVSVEKIEVKSNGELGVVAPGHNLAPLGPRPAEPTQVAAAHRPRPLGMVVVVVFLEAALEVREGARVPEAGGHVVRDRPDHPGHVRVGLETLHGVPERSAGCGRREERVGGVIE